MTRDRGADDGVNVCGRRGATATAVVDASTTESDALALVRVERASAAMRTRPEPEATEAFFPEVVRALRRSSANSRLESLAMSARECRQ